MDYKPYSLEWSRKRYLSEAIYKYFEDGVQPQCIADEINDILDDAAKDYAGRSERFSSVQNGIRKP